MKDFNARVFRLLAKEMKVDDLTVPKEEPGGCCSYVWLEAILVWPLRRGAGGATEVVDARASPSRFAWRHARSMPP